MRCWVTPTYIYIRSVWEMDLKVQEDGDYQECLSYRPSMLTNWNLKFLQYPIKMWEKNVANVCIMKKMHHATADWGSSATFNYIFVYFTKQTKLITYYWETLIWGNLGYFVTVCSCRELHEQFKFIWLKVEAY